MTTSTNARCVKVRFAGEDARQLERAAAGTGQTLTGFVREAALGRRLPAPIPEVNRELFSEAVRVSLLLGDLARRFEADGGGLGEELKAAIEHYEAVLGRVCSTLLGGEQR